VSFSNSDKIIEYILNNPTPPEQGFVLLGGEMWGTSEWDLCDAPCIHSIKPQGEEDRKDIFWFYKWATANNCEAHLDPTCPEPRNMVEALHRWEVSPWVYELWCHHREDFKATALLHKEIVDYDRHRASSGE